MLRFEQRTMPLLTDINNFIIDYENNNLDNVNLFFN